MGHGRGQRHRNSILNAVKELVGPGSLSTEAMIPPVSEIIHMINLLARENIGSNEESD